MRFLKRLFSRKPKVPNIREGFEKANQLAEDLDSLSVYLEQIPKLHEAENLNEILDYARKASFGLCSFRDELQIFMRKGDYERFRKGLTSSTESANNSPERANSSEGRGIVVGSAEPASKFRSLN